MIKVKIKFGNLVKFAFFFFLLCAEIKDIYGLKDVFIDNNAYLFIESIIFKKLIFI